MKIKDRLKIIRYETDPSMRGHGLEAHHIEQRHNGGPTTKENMFALSKPEHAYIHYLESNLTTDRREIAANNWATKKILRRMTQDEREEYRGMITSRRQPT